MSDFEPEQKKKEFEQPIYKEWFKTNSAAGFITITPWLTARKLVLDIGSVDPNSNKVTSNTQFYVNALDLHTYLQSVINGSAVEIYPKRSQCPSPESFVAFGASGTDSRVLKVHYWGAGSDKDGDPNGFAWKVGLFGGKKSASGAVEPQWNDIKSRDQIRRSRLEMHRIAHAVNFSLIHFAAASKDGLALLP